jgi:hypothetical protein
MVAVFWPQSYAGPVIQPKPSLFWLLHWHFQPLTSPQTLNALVIDLPAGISQQNCDSAVAVSTILTHQLDHVRHQAIFVCTAPWWASLG